MYLEISQRQSGKTTRMINQMYADKNRYDIQIVFGYSKFYTHRIQNIHISDNLKSCSTYESLCEILDHYCNDHTVKLYVDEFAYMPEFCNNITHLIKTYRKIVEDGYFTSTPPITTLGSEAMLKLTNINRNSYYKFGVVYEKLKISYK